MNVRDIGARLFHSSYKETDAGEKRCISKS